ncbi:MAG: hypothetical protein HYY41_05055 [Chloroflexi bacterium]|nr:hypothetical protein [Chloroflexota bacterium]MBI2980177.1 hypothetical protein [Chloroflexota bacterium]
MCERCGCQEFIKNGKEAVRKRAVDIVKELQLNPNNIDDYECTETISGMIAPFGNRDDEVYQTASWISGLHQGMRRLDRDERYQNHVRAFRDLFARLPIKGDPKHITTTYHQLEQLARELDEKTIASLDPDTRQTINTVNHIHEDSTRRARLQKRYGL